MSSSQEKVFHYEKLNARALPFRCSLFHRKRNGHNALLWTQNLLFLILKTRRQLWIGSEHTVWLRDFHVDDAGSVRISVFFVSTAGVA